MPWGSSDIQGEVNDERKAKDRAASLIGEIVAGIKTTEDAKLFLAEHHPEVWRRVKRALKARAVGPTS